MNDKYLKPNNTYVKSSDTYQIDRYASGVAKAGEMTRTDKYVSKKTV